MNRIFDGKVALVTGAASGIGRATARAFAAAGARVAVTDVRPQGEETVAEIRRDGGEALFVRADVASPAELERMVSQVVGAFGGLDVAFNNAGVEGARAATADYELDEWDRVLRINLRGVWLCMKLELPHLLARGGGAIVNCVSIAGLVGFATSPAYVASKHGIVGLTRTAALEYATRGVRINAVCPGVIDTAMIDRIVADDRALAASLTAGEPVGRLGTPDEVAAAVLWLASDAASFVTGTALPVDGGWVAQ